MEIHIHQVDAFEVEEDISNYEVDGRIFYTRTIRIRSKEGKEITSTVLFSDRKENLDLIKTKSI